MTEKITTLSVFSGVADKVARVAGSLVALSALAYFVGYRLQSSYLSELGAGWAIKIYSTADLIQKGQWVVIITATTLALSLINQLQAEERGTEHKGREDIWLLLAGAGFISASYAAPYFSSNHAIEYGLTTVAGLLLIGATGFTIGDLISDYRASSLSWRSKHLTTLLIIYVSAAIVAPKMVGSNLAKLHLDKTLSLLPTVQPSGKANGEWRLVEVVTGSYLLVQFSGSTSARQFMIVPANSDYQISSTSK